MKNALSFAVGKKYLKYFWYYVLPIQDFLCSPVKGYDQTRLLIFYRIQKWAELNENSKLSNIISMWGFWISTIEIDLRPVGVFWGKWDSQIQRLKIDEFIVHTSLDFSICIYLERLILQPINLNSATADRNPGFPLIGCNFKSLVDIWSYSRFRGIRESGQLLQK